MSDSTIIEICVDAVDSALAVQQGGANRIELCGNLLEGGTTPSAGLIAVIRQKISIGLQVMIRPRGGDFCYSSDEFEIMKQDIATAKLLGVNGLVLGLLDFDGTVDVPRTRELVELCKPLPVTFHRAFDVAANLSQALEDVISTGAARVLTSGGQPSAREGIDSLAKLVHASAGRITILAGGGINDRNVREIVEKSGISEVHAGLKSIVPGRMMMQSNKKISPGITGLDESQRFVVLQENVEKMKQALT